MRARLERTQNKLTLDIPKDFATTLHLQANTEVQLTLHEGSLTITPLSELNELLARISPANLHGEIETGLGTGQEAW